MTGMDEGEKMCVADSTARFNILNNRKHKNFSQFTKFPQNAIFPFEKQPSTCQLLVQIGSRLGGYSTMPMQTEVTGFNANLIYTLERVAPDEATTRQNKTVGMNYTKNVLTLSRKP